jgi:RNA methyltransferase, TrmH family
MDRAYGDRAATEPALRRPAAPTDAVPTAAEAAGAVISGRRDPGRVLLEGVHALKHAIRFGADVEVVCTPDRVRLAALLVELAPDVALPAATVQLDPDAWRAAVGRELPSPAVAVAVRPAVDVGQLLAARGIVVGVEHPRHLGNLGAVVRVAAAAGAGGVLVLGDADPWHPTAVRAAAGLQFALPVARTAVLPAVARPVVALDPDGSDLAGPLPSDALLVVGTERGGLSGDLLRRADHRVRLPMRAGVSSLNLATAVAAALYAGTLGQPPPR